MKLNANELTQDINKNIKYSINQIINSIDFNRYPDPSYNTLKIALSNLYELSPSNVLCGNGSDELLSILFDHLLLSSNQSSTLGFMSPSFSEYKNIATIKSIPYKEYVFDIDQSVEVNDIINFIIQNNITCFIICYPNNPIKINYTSSGESCFSIEDVIDLILSKTNTTIILDEAYGEFNGLDNFLKPSLKENVIRLRTLSKAWGLASLRVGYMLAPSDMINDISISKPLYNINALSSEIASYVINNRVNAILSNVSMIQRERNHLIEMLKASSLYENGYKLYDSNANFITLKIFDFDLFNKICLRNQIEVRYFSLASNINIVRITVGNDNVNKKILDTLIEYETCYNNRQSKIA